MKACIFFILGALCCVGALAEVPAPIQKTGQTTSYRGGDDGAFEAGVAWPNPRFTDQDDGTVLDNLTGLEWVKAPHSLPENSSIVVRWSSGINFCNNLSYADHSDWRLPSVKELMSLVDYGRYNPALPIGHPFVGVKNDSDVSGTTAQSSYYDGASIAFFIVMSDGEVDLSQKITDCYVWPVRTH